MDMPWYLHNYILRSGFPLSVGCCNGIDVYDFTLQSPTSVQELTKACSYLHFLPCLVNIVGV
jgi:hypothetical protein